MKSFIGFHGNIYHQGRDVWPIQCLITGLKGQLQEGQEAHRKDRRHAGRTGGMQEGQEAHRKDRRHAGRTGGMQEGQEEACRKR